MVSTRRYKLGLDLVFKPLIDWFESRIVSEDQASSNRPSPPRRPAPGVELSVATDVATLRFRKRATISQHQRELARADLAELEGAEARDAAGATRVPVTRELS